MTQTLTPKSQNSKTVAVLVPHYREELTPDEKISLRHLNHYLGHYDTFQISPKRLRDVLPGFEVKRFADNYFLSVLHYNKLMLSPHFYKTFSDYKFVLIYQFDALVFSDRLLEFCEKDFDYIGAPWLKDVNHPEYGFSNVGNGGFCLRKVESILRVLNSDGIVIDPELYWEEYCRNHSKAIQLLSFYKKYLIRLSIFSNVKWYTRHPHDLEDIFWANIAPRVWPGFRIAPVKEGLKFSFESAPQYCFEQNNYQLPFGCHAWTTNDRKFWEPHLLPSP
jgi:hypothetical protein